MIFCWPPCTCVWMYSWCIPTSLRTIPGGQESPSPLSACQDCSVNSKFLFLGDRRLSILEMMVILYMYLHGNLPGTNIQQLKEFLFWALLFGPLLFPVSLIMWHSYQLYKGEQNFLKFENLARSRVLNSLSVLTKSALQLVLQTSIIMITWSTEHDVWLRLYRIGSIVMSLLVIANAATGHHYFVSSGKDTHGREITNTLLLCHHQSVCSRETSEAFKKTVTSDVQHYSCPHQRFCHLAAGRLSPIPHSHLYLPHDRQ